MGCIKYVNMLTVLIRCLIIEARNYERTWQGFHALSLGSLN